MRVGGGTGDDIPIVEEDAGESTEVASADTGDETSEGGEGEAAEGGDSEASAEAEATPTPQPKVEVDPPDAEAVISRPSTYSETFPAISPPKA